MRKLYFFLFISILLACNNDNYLFSVWRPHFKQNGFYTKNGAELRISANKDTILIVNGKPAITPYSAYIKGEFTFVQDTIIQYGHCWSTTNPFPVIDPKDTSTFSRFYNWPYDSLGTFVSRISFMPETPFYVRAYVITKSGDTGYLAVSYTDTTLPPVNEWFKTNKLGFVGRENAAAFTFYDPGLQKECGYVVGGNNFSEVFADMWRYDPDDQTWTQMPGQLPTPLTKLVAFGAWRKNINGQIFYEIYAGTGQNLDGTIKYNNFYRYSFGEGSWRPISPYPNAVSGAVAFVIENRPFVGLGNNQNGADVGYFFEFHPELVDSAGAVVWKAVTDFGNDGQTYRRHDAIAFVVNNRAFVGTGCHITENNDTIYYKDLWMFVPPEGIYQGKWYKRADFPSTARSQAVAFTATDQGFVGLGCNSGHLFKDFYRYDPFTNRWFPIADYKLGPEYTGQNQPTKGAVAFGIENKGFVGLGYQGDTVQNPYTNEFWIYRP